MLTSLSLKGYRAFKSLEVEDLGQVNLFVGKNNCGKTTILEAAEMLLDRADPTIIIRSSERRGEVSKDAFSKSLFKTKIDIRHLFYGHEIKEKSSFEIKGKNNSKIIYLKCKISSDAPPKNHRYFYLEESEDDEITSDFDIFIEHSDWDKPSIIPLPIDGGLSTRSLRENIVKEPADNKPACFIRTEDFDNLKMGDLWDAIALTDEEPKVIQALKIIEPKIDRIAFLSRFDNMSGVFVRLEDLNDRVPLGSLGDGVRHLLIISLAVIRSIGGAVMIDEIDTGLHHTVMTDMWRMLIKTAKRLNVQVFATTHSLDCVRSLAWLHEQEPDICQGVRLHRVDIEYDKTTVYSPQEIALAAKHHAEIRG